MKNKRILVVSGWQDVNIGDITHTPGLLHILETYLPSVQVTLWKRSNGEDVKTMLNQNFPNVKIIYGGVDEQLNVNNPEITEAFKNHDFMLHGSGPSIVGQQNLEAWIKATGKPFGIFGTTIQDINPKLKALLQKASFIYTRETASIKVLNDNGISGSHIGFAPDATFYIDLENKQKADAFLKSAGLTPGKFICAVPRLRYTPYHKFKQTGWSQQRINLVETTNEKFKEQDHAKLREAIVTWVRQTKNKVLVCPEMTYEVDIMDELLINPLPDDVKPYVVKRGYWLPDEAASVYEQAFSVLSFECHSPIIAAAKKSLFLYLRQPEDTIKGQMYYDLDFNDWVFEIEQTTGKQISDRLMSTWNNQAGAKKALAQSMAKVDKLYKAATTLVAASI
ncbi:polysaccharide pyruvyl transferase [Dyadobacter beijingensis]|uniref:Polysaccharide pyruvyl transferase n=1 Tax=Dyadobacter beijingensis TaxID=365489 RepID=A0ABQ2HSG3_9BACT|nr:polysaccharide pyruvyl transferase family protein [Dyadobacter beijingensis]GGM90362.1 polysaccharide pyruvyl transferase [Dyadobacter beijingensis]